MLANRELSEVFGPLATLIGLYFMEMTGTFDFSLDESDIKRILDKPSPFSEVLKLSPN